MLKRPVYVEMTILDNSKILMYDFYYNVLGERYGSKYELVCMDTDSLQVEVEKEDFYKDMEEDADLYHTMDYPKEHFLHSKKKYESDVKDER